MFDPKCYELARLFLWDHPEKDCDQARCELAQVIQDSIEGWIESAKPAPYPNVADLMDIVRPVTEPSDDDSINTDVLKSFDDGANRIGLKL